MAAVELYALIYGRVQKVGFRATACDYAARLGIHGTVQNRSDGSVEIYAQGEKAALEELLKQLKSHFDIVNITVDYRSITLSKQGFHSI